MVAFDIGKFHCVRECCRGSKNYLGTFYVTELSIILSALRSSQSHMDSPQIALSQLYQYHANLLICKNGAYLALVKETTQVDEVESLRNLPNVPLRQRATSKPCSHYLAENASSSSNQ